jgi:hypothetical protein
MVQINAKRIRSIDKASLTRIKFILKPLVKESISRKGYIFLFGYRKKNNFLLDLFVFCVITKVFVYYCIIHDLMESGDD